jgi:hypothetical protein
VISIILDAKRPMTFWLKGVQVDKNHTIASVQGADSFARQATLLILTLSYRLDHLC